MLIFGLSWIVVSCFDGWFVIFSFQTISNYPSKNLQEPWQKNNGFLQIFP